MTKPKPKTEAAKKTTTSTKKPANKNGINKDTMTGDLRDAILQFVRDLKKPWAQMSEMEQRGTIAAVEKRAQALVAEIVKVIAADGRKVIEGKLEQITVNDGLKAIVTLSKTHRLRHEVLDAVQKAVLIVVSDAQEFTGEQAPAAYDKDQKVLPLDKPVADSGKNIPQNVDKKANAGLKGLDKLKASTEAEKK